MALTFEVITLFPGMVRGVFSESIISRALKAELIQVNFTDPRDFTTDNHRSVDDKPYGGGPGMVLKPEPFFKAVESIDERVTIPPEKTRRLLFTPQGRPLKQKDFRNLAQAECLYLLCGHYEGFDERIREGLGFEEVSIGDYVLTGGEIPAMTVIDGVTRLLPGALGNEESIADESFESGLLEYPQYTRPFDFRGMKVPEVLLSGNHAEIEKWRRKESLRRTQSRREDLLNDSSE